MTTPRVSVLIPAYNRARYLREAICSVLAGDYQDFEIIISDDCSPNDLSTTVAGFGDPRLRFRRNATNLGVAGNVRTAIGAARGVYIALLNDDDFWDSTFLSHLVPVLDTHPAAVLAFCDHRIVDADGEFLRELTDRNSRNRKRDQLRKGLHYSTCELATDGSIAPATAVLFRREVVDWSRIPDAVGPAYDVWMAYLACITGLPAFYLPERLTNYRLHPQMQTQSSRLQHALGAARVYSLMAEDPAMAKLHMRLLHMCGLSELSAGIALLLSGNQSDAKPHIRRALRMAPTPRGLFAMALTWLPHQLTTRVIGAIRRVRSL
jgi:hypothetical protein